VCLKKPDRESKVKNRKKQIHKFVCQAIQNQRVSFRYHALCRSQERGISSEDILYSVFTGAVFEENSDVTPLPTCSIGGRTRKGKRVHSFWGYNEETGYIVLISLYDPDANHWINSHRRR
jgi:hypothetical protein